MLFIFLEGGDDQEMFKALDNRGGICVWVSKYP